MPSLGPAEILVVVVIALLVFGPDKMPDMARQAGRAFREFRRVQQHLRDEIHDAVGDLTGSGPAVTPGGDPAPTLPPRTDQPGPGTRVEGAPHDDMSADPNAATSGPSADDPGPAPGPAAGPEPGSA